MITDKTLSDRLVDLLREAFHHCREVAGNAPAFGYAILTNDDGNMFVPVLGADRGTFTNIDPKDLRFDPSNWDIGAPKNVIAEGSTLLNALSDQCEDWDNDEHWHKEFRARSYLLLVRCLEQLLQEGFFGPQSKTQPFVIVWGVNSTLPNISGRAWCKRLNPPSTYKQFLRWIERKYAQ